MIVQRGQLPSIASLDLPMLTYLILLKQTLTFLVHCGQLHIGHICKGKPFLARKTVLTIQQHKINLKHLFLILIVMFLAYTQMSIKFWLAFWHNRA